MKNIREFDDFEGQDGYLIVDGLTEDVSGGKKKLSDIVSEQVQSDWEQDDTTAKDYIKNKPDVSNKIESISIADTELEPDENKNVNIGLGNWLNIDSNNNLYVIPNFGGGTGGLNCDCDSDYDLSVSVDDSTIGIYHDGGNLHVICDNDTIYDTNRGIGVLYDNDTITTKNGYGLEVANPVPDTDNANNGDVLTYNGDTDEIVWQTPQGGASLPDTPSDYATRNYVLGFNKSTGELAWQEISNGSGGASPYK